MVASYRDALSLNSRMNFNQKFWGWKLKKKKKSMEQNASTTQVNMYVYFCMRVCSVVSPFA